jgi:hypothetical protein
MEELVVELDIHIRIEEHFYYPAMTAASKAVAIPRTGHRQLFDQLVAILHTPPSVPTYENDWESFKTVIDAHVDEQECDLASLPAQEDIVGAELDALGNQMLACMQKLRDSKPEKLDSPDVQASPELSH